MTRAAAAASVFAVEPAAVQVSWPALPPGTHRITTGPAAADIAGGGAAAVVLEGLAPASRYEIAVDGAVVASATTLAAPPGRLLSKVATISDLHIGERVWGYLPKLSDDRPGVPLPPTRCLTATLEEITAWGPDALVVKGDLTAKCRRVEFEECAQMLKGLLYPVLVVPGNHDSVGDVDDLVVACMAAVGLETAMEVTHLDLPGLRIVLLPTVGPGRTSGWMTADRLDRLARAMRESPGPVLVCMHHQPMRHRIITHWPTGIVHKDARQLLDTIVSSNRASFVTAGHTHRNRRWPTGPVPVTEVGSIKDYPGTWGAYYAYEGGIVQSVRRVQGRAAIEWTERTRAMLFGMWGRYAPGRLSERCFTHVWPAR